ncbi:alpha/beta hydrolase fold-domain-containing protein [Zychaea mexicana]|uniref:alpha/beta hydrolase fold-domain-containing protein n=1 Tax=Zychaea mexicana TaxID=64656 RepID=UPI0022FEBCD9|nr:alpha/beta hydrolase fold-domain-containing protein [Zychaea mexicana]KAI9490885.1 alpha/beta hydrolase fold-domain-containing protein [Zychaea mexicana]
MASAASAVVTLDPVYDDYIKQAKSTPFPSISNGEITIQELRATIEQGYVSQQLPVIIEEDRTVAYKDTELRLTLFRPLGTENEVLPCGIFYHGGGWVFCSKRTHGKPVRDICINNHVAIVFVNYSLAPEVKFPVINEECFLALQWVLENGKSINVDTSKLAVIGDSAGGHLATTTALMAKEHGLDRAIKAQIIIYPVTAPTREHYESNKLYGTGSDFVTVKKDDAAFFDEIYIPNHAKSNKLAFPLLATVDELQNLPPALLVTAEADAHRDEGEEYAHKLLEAGVITCAVRILGAIHGFFSFPLKKTPAYRQTQALITQQLNEAFGEKEL